MSELETRRVTVALLRGMTLRCARCGKGGVFKGWFRIVERCPRCGLRFEQDEGSRLGSAMVNYAVVGGTLVAYIVLALIVTLPDPPVWPLVGGAVALVLVVAIVFFPFAKTIWSALDLVMKGFDVGDR